jgi:hypothetical protein
MGMVAEVFESPAPFVYTSILLNYNVINHLEAVGTSILTLQTMSGEVVSSGDLSGRDTDFLDVVSSK